MSGNLRVDSLQVMFGVLFGPEIDIWSLGCILAEVVSLNYLPTCVVNQCQCTILDLELLRLNITLSELRTLSVCTNNFIKLILKLENGCFMWSVLFLSLRCSNEKKSCNINYLITKSEVITGKSQTEALLY